MLLVFPTSIEATPVPAVIQQIMCLALLPTAQNSRTISQLQCSLVAPLLREDPSRLMTLRCRTARGTGLACRGAGTRRRSPGRRSETSIPGHLREEDLGPEAPRSLGLSLAMSGCGGEANKGLRAANSEHRVSTIKTECFVRGLILAGSSTACPLSQLGRQPG